MQSIDHTLFENGAQRELDKSLLVKFFYKQRPDSSASLKEGRPMFKEVVYIDIKVAGSRNGGACRPAREDDKARFPDHYHAFKTRTEAPTTGTPLAEWALMSRSLVEELAYHNVKTVEQLTTMPDVHLSKFQGLNTLKAKALKWLDNSDETARLNQISALEARLSANEKLLETTLARLDNANKEIAELEAPKAEKPEVKLSPQQKAARTRRRNALRAKED